VGLPFFYVQYPKFMLLAEIIKEKIQKEGPLSFRDFMDIALYHPSLGYYNSDKNKIGQSGDYYTSPVLSALFGTMIGKQIEEMWHLLEKRPFTIVEFGAGTGALCADILNHLKKNDTLYQELRYCIIEKSSSMQQREKSLLHEKVSWHNSISEIPNLNGCVLSNELLDNFPVHKVMMKEELMEVFVDYKNGFVEKLFPASKQILHYFLEQNIVLPEGYSTEVNLQAIDWLTEIASSLKNGFVLTVDYGFTAEELYNAARNSGTLVCFKDHQVNYLPYSNIGEQDITVHVNFSALDHWGKKNGLELTGFTTQNHFLRSLGLMNYLRDMELSATDEQSRESIFQINKLLLDMGNKFKVLIQQKGVKGKLLSGIQFSIPIHT
jgi:SAM-dependent MidA family methyltransferase